LARCAGAIGRILRVVGQSFANRWKAAGVAAVCVAAAILSILFGSTPQFEAQATLRFESLAHSHSATPSVPPGSDFLPHHQERILSGEFAEFLYSGLPIADRIAFASADEPTGFFGQLADWFAPGKNPGEDTPDRQKAHFLRNARRIQVGWTQSGSSGDLQVTVRHPQANVAARIANAWVSGYIDFAQRRTAPPTGEPVTEPFGPNTIRASDLSAQTPIASLSELKNRLSDKRAEEAKLDRRYLPKHPAMVEVRREIGVLEADIHRAAGQNSPVPAQTPANRSDDFRLSPAVRAVTPSDPVFPDKPHGILVAGSALAGVFVAIPLLLALRDWFRGAKRPGRRGKPAPLASLWQGSGARTTATTRRSANVRAKVEILATLPQFSIGAAGESPRQILRSLFQDCTLDRSPFDAAACALTAASRRGETQIILVSSHAAGAGKTLFSCGLGLSILTKGRSVLIVDAHRNRPSLARCLPRAGAAPSLAHFATAPAAENGASPALPDLESLRIGASHLHTLEAGNEEPHAANPFGQAWFAKFIARCKSRVDCIILDGPPMNCEPDISQLGAFATQSVLVRDAEENASGSWTPQGATVSLAEICPGSRLNTVVLNRAATSRFQTAFPSRTPRSLP
jgi:Mrp family chromosome partitioning ATPase